MPGIVFCKGSTSPLYRTIKQCTCQGLYFVRDQTIIRTIKHYIELYRTVYMPGIVFCKGSTSPLYRTIKQCTVYMPGIVFCKGSTSPLYRTI